MSDTENQEQMSIFKEADTMKKRRKGQLAISRSMTLKKQLKKPVRNKTSTSKTLQKSTKSKVDNKNSSKTVPKPFNLEDHPDSFIIENYTDLARDIRHKPDDEKQCQRFLCSICNSYRTLLIENLKQHIQLHAQGKLNCKTCNFIADSPNNLRCHMSEKHPGLHGMVICEFCGTVKGCTQSYKAHLSKVHGIPAHSCSHCEKGFHSRKTLKKHMLSVHESSVYQCDKCKKITMSKIGLEQHSKTCERFYKCKYCDHVKDSKRELELHVRYTHAKVSRNKHMCSICTFSAITKQQLTNHMNAHLGIHQYSCDLCDFSCVKKYQLDSHQRRHTGEKKFKCDKCCYAAAWNVQLKTHMKAHDSDTQCLCKECGIVLKDQRCLKLHKLKEHGNSSDKTVSRSGQ